MSQRRFVGNLFSYIGGSMIAVNSLVERRITLVYAGFPFKNTTP